MEVLLTWVLCGSNTQLQCLLPYLLFKGTDYQNHKIIFSWKVFPFTVYEESLIKPGE